MVIRKRVSFKKSALPDSNKWLAFVNNGGSSASSGLSDNNDKNDSNLSKTTVSEQQDIPTVKYFKGYVSGGTDPTFGFFNEHGIWTNSVRMNLELRFDHLVYKVLPRMAKEKGWVVREDHCFMRILYDNALGDAWYKKLKDERGRVLRRIPTDALAIAVQIGDELAMYDGSGLEELNNKSLTWRRKK